MTGQYWAFATASSYPQPRALRDQTLLCPRMPYIQLVSVKFMSDALVNAHLIVVYRRQLQQQPDGASRPRRRLYVAALTLPGLFYLPWVKIDACCCAAIAPADILVTVCCITHLLRRAPP